MNIEYNTYIKAVPETDVDRDILTMLIEQPGEKEALEEYISEMANKSFEPLIYTNYKGINLLLEMVSMLPC